MQQGLLEKETGKGNSVTEINILAENLAETVDMNQADKETPAVTLIDRAITAVQGAEQKIEAQAKRIADLERMVMVDPLTGLLNRRGFEKELRRVLATARRYDEQGVLIYLDLDDFKRVNDTYGHLAGDEMLKQVACFLDKSVRRSDYVARLGGDEFAILLIKISDMNGVLRAEIMNRRLNQAYLRWKGKMIGIRASLGIQPFDGTETVEELLDKADRAMYKNKRRRTGPLPAKVTA